MKKNTKLLVSVHPAIEYFWLVLPVILLLSGCIPAKSNPAVLVVVLIIIGLIIFSRVTIGGQWTLYDLGFKIKVWDKTVIIVYVLTTLIFCSGFYVIYPLIHEVKHTVTLNPKSITFSFLVSIGQVIVFQAYLMKAGEMLFKSKITNILVNTSLFTFMHAFFPLDVGEYVLLFVAGLGFSGIYSIEDKDEKGKYKNIYLVGMFHFATNLVSIHMSMFHMFEKSF